MERRKLVVGGRKLSGAGRQRNIRGSRGGNIQRCHLVSESRVMSMIEEDE